VRGCAKHVDMYNVRQLSLEPRAFHNMKALNGRALAMKGPVPVGQEYRWLILASRAMGVSSKDGNEATCLLALTRRPE